LLIRKFWFCYAVPHSMRLVICSCAAALLAFGIYSVLRGAYAAHLAGTNSLAGSERALEIDGDSAAYWLHRADLLDQAGLPATEALARAAQINPWDATARIRLGLDAEARGDFGAAERHLLEAARVSRLYQPRWTLANFYFRRGSAAPFWRWARSALELSPREPAALYQLCWRFSTDADEIFAKAIPPGPQTSRTYLGFLVAENRLEAADAAAARLVPDAASEDRELLGRLCDRFLDARMAHPALAVWNGLCARGLLPYRRLQTSDGQSLANGDFTGTQFGPGFNWRANAVPGVVARMGSGQLAVFFSGRQPETAELVWSWIAVTAGAKYVLHFEYQTSGIAQPSGLQWCASAGNSDLASSTPLASPEWKTETIAFSAPADAHLLRLRLAAERMPGSVRISGTVMTRRMRLEQAP
jgi:tetratricopeptide (TPR) repeat protein